MSNLKNNQMTGLLLGQRHGDPIVTWDTIPNVAVQSTSPSNWQLLSLRSPIPLTNEAETSAREFVYEYLLRSSRDHHMLVSTQSDLVESLLSICPFARNLVPPRIEIDKLVTDLSVRPDSQIGMGAIFARVNGYGRSLRSISLYGDDIADAQLFQNMRSQLLPYRVELRDLITGNSLLSVGSRGELSFYYAGAESCNRAIRAMKFLSGPKRYIHWPE